VSRRWRYVDSQRRRPYLIARCVGARTPPYRRRLCENSKSRISNRVFAPKAQTYSNDIWRIGLYEHRGRIAVKHLLTMHHPACEQDQSDAQSFAQQPAECMRKKSSRGCDPAFIHSFPSLPLCALTVRTSPWSHSPVIGLAMFWGIYVSTELDATRRTADKVEYSIFRLSD
jgi:hypothetical protein